MADKVGGRSGSTNACSRDTVAQDHEYQKRLKQENHTLKALLSRAVESDEGLYTIRCDYRDAVDEHTRTSKKLAYSQPPALHTTTMQHGRSYDPHEDLLYELVTLQILSKQDLTSHGDLVWHMSRLASCIASLMDKIISSHLHPDRLCFTQTVECLMRACAAGTTVLLTAYTVLVRQRSITSIEHGQATSTLASLFDSLISLLEKAAGEPGLISGDVNDGTTLDRDQDASRTCNESILKSLDFISQVVLNMLVRSKSLLPKHNELFEAFASCVIGKIGDRLYSVVLNHKRQALEDEIRMAGLTVRVSPVDTDSSRLLDGHLLRCLELLASGISQVGTRSGQSSNDAASTTHSTNLHLAVKKRLQKIMLEAVFGERECLLLDKDRFRMPAGQQPPIVQPPGNTLTHTDWFQQEIWMILGWDVFAEQPNTV